jgi:group I intron endonuclease
MILEKSYKESCIYVILNIREGLFYVGQTRKYCVRANAHFAALKNQKHKNIWLQRLYNQGTAFLIFPVEKCIEKMLNEREKFWIEYHNTNNRNHGYNLSEGGDFSYSTLTEEAKKRRADARKNKPGSLKGRPQSKEWIEARRLKTSGTKRTYTEAHLNAIRKARSLAKGTRQKGKEVTLENISTGKIEVFQSKREVEDFLGIPRDKLIHKFYQGRPRRILKEIRVGNYLITR